MDMKMTMKTTSPSSASERIFFLVILLGALLFYYAGLSLKPPHADEGVNGFFVNQIWQNGFFVYDPTNYHGPLLFYLFQVSEKIFGFGVSSFRIVTATFSLLTVGVILKCREELGRHAVFFTALALAFSPGMIFFGRSAIHESVFVFFQVLWIMGFLRLRERMDRKGFLCFSLGLLGCLLLKETFALLGISFLLAWSWMEISPKILSLINKKIESPGPKSSEPDKIYLLKLCLVVVFAWLFVYTGFFHNWKGASDFFIAFMPWMKTGVGGSGHEKPYYYWLDLIMRYEWVGVVGIAAALPGVISSSWKVRFFSSLALINGFIYSVIPYKTPWCIISILWPFFVLAGLYMASLVDKVRLRSSLFSMLLMCAVAVAMGHSMFAAYKLNFVNYADPAEPYVYVQTKNDIKIVEDIIRKKILTSPDFKDAKMQVNVKDSWPLPWLFSHFPHVEFGNENEPPLAGADIIFTEQSVNNNNLAGSYLARKIDLRDAREPIYVYLKNSAFEGIDLPGFSAVQPPEGKRF